MPIPKEPVPIYQDRVTFDSLNKHWKEHPPKPRGPKGPNFGTADRFGVDEKLKYKKQAKLWNSGQDGRKIDVNGDPVPGPGNYNTIEIWKGKINKPKKTKDPNKRCWSAAPKVGERILKSISKGPSFSIYNSRNY